jgi:hypothetical protein
VRKSIANHLNDIAKDHPDYVIQCLKAWTKSAKNPADQEKINWITRRSLRTLIKNGHPGALALIGVSHGAEIEVRKLSTQKNRIKLGQALDFKFEIHSISSKPQKLVIDYIVHFMKSNRETAPKVFKLKTVTIPANGRLTLEKSHSVKKITTREYYPGKQRLELQINGKSYGSTEWHLELLK